MLGLLSHRATPYLISITLRPIHSRTHLGTFFSFLGYLFSTYSLQLFATPSYSIPVGFPRLPALQTHSIGRLLHAISSSLAQSLLLGHITATLNRTRNRGTPSVVDHYSTFPPIPFRPLSHTPSCHPPSYKARKGRSVWIREIGHVSRRDFSPSWRGRGFPAAVARAFSQAYPSSDTIVTKPKINAHGPLTSFTYMLVRTPHLPVMKVARGTGVVWGMRGNQLEWRKKDRMSRRMSFIKPATCGKLGRFHFD